MDATASRTCGIAEEARILDHTSRNALCRLIAPFFLAINKVIAEGVNGFPTEGALPGHTIL